MVGFGQETDVQKTSEIRIEDGPGWDAQVSIRGVTLRLVSPLEMDGDLPLAPVPDQAEIDRLTRRRRGAIVRLWRWLVGEPGLQRVNVPDDGGAMHARQLCLAMYGRHHAEFLATLTTGEIFQLTQFYMGYQQRWAQAIGDWAAEQASVRYAEPAQESKAMHDVVMAAFGPPVHRYATGIVASDQTIPSLAFGANSGGQPDHGDHTSNGAVKFPGGER